MNLKDILTSWKRWFCGNKTSESGPESWTPQKPLKEMSELPNVDHSEFVLYWVTKEVSKNSYAYEFTAGDKHIWSEPAHFEWTDEAFRTLQIIVQKYENRIIEIRMDSGTGIYVGGDSTSRWENFIRNVESLGFRRIHKELVKKVDSKRSEIVLQDIVFVSRRAET